MQQHVQILHPIESTPEWPHDDWRQSQLLVWAAAFKQPSDASQVEPQGRPPKCLSQGGTGRPRRER
eukprot:12536054-Alexandrium_andersonii.AAC.1